MSSSSSSNDNDYTGRVKDSSREGRLSFRNFAEHQLRNEFKREAIKKCNLQIKAFAECGKEEGIMVVFRCRDFKKAVDECMEVYNSKERWELFKKENAADLENRVIKSKD